VGDQTKRKVSQGAAEAHAGDPGRTTTESGFETAAGLRPEPSDTNAQASRNSTVTQVNAGSSDR
jgi:hypothetical protein